MCIAVGERDLEADDDELQQEASPIRAAGAIKISRRRCRMSRVINSWHEAPAVLADNGGDIMPCLSPVAQHSI